MEEAPEGAYAVLWYDLKGGDIMDCLFKLVSELGRVIELWWECEIDGSISPHDVECFRDTCVAICDALKQMFSVLPGRSEEDV